MFARCELHSAQLQVIDPQTGSVIAAFPDYAKNPGNIRLSPACFCCNRLSAR